MTVDPTRLARALHLKVDRAASGWVVNDRYVDDLLGCSCPDRTIRGGQCKHELATRLAVLDREILDKLRELVTP
jgi:hypothetical protein